MSSLKSEFLEAADKIGARLCRDAIFAGDLCNWIGPSLKSDEGRALVVQRAFGPNLYEGTSGIGLFLAHLAEHTGDPVQRRTARAALRHALSTLNSDVPDMGIGLYSGVTGIVYTVIETDKVFPNEGLATLGLSALRRLPFATDESVDVDLISGRAGAILGLLAISRRRPEDSFLEAAVRLGEILLRERIGEMGCGRGVSPSFR